MKFNINIILYTVLVGVLGYFTRDIYNYLKSKLFKGNKPIVDGNYSYRHSGSRGLNPRIHEFESILIFQNIDTEPIYDINVYLNKNGTKELLLSKKFLKSTGTIEKKEIQKVPIQDDPGDSSNLAAKLLPVHFTNPLIQISYKNKRGHKFRMSIDKRENGAVQ